MRALRNILSALVWVVGAATEEVTVSADATLLRTESSDLTHIIPA